MHGYLLLDKNIGDKTSNYL